MSKISVVIATYNGEKFIEEQLESIRQQSRAVNEVLIADDCSTDNTVEIIQNFIDKYKLQHWFVKVNQKNVGWKRNFTNLIFQASGDIIFYCDQDDIWFSNKVDVMASVLEENKQIFCLSSHYISIDSKGRILNQGLDVKALETGTLSRISIDDRRFFYVPAGCTLAFRSQLLSFMDYNFCECGTDRILVRTAILLNSMYDIDLSLIKHRFHENNASNSINNLKEYYGSSTLIDRIQYVKEDLLYFESLKKFRNIFNEEYVNFFDISKKRFKILNNKNVFLLFTLLCQNKPKFIKIIVLGDFLYSIGLNRCIGRLCRYMRINFK